MPSALGVLLYGNIFAVCGGGRLHHFNASRCGESESGRVQSSVLCPSTLAACTQVLRLLSACLNVAQFKGVYEDEENIHILMEWCKGGELTGAIAMAHYSEHKVRTVKVMNVMLRPN